MLFTESESVEVERIIGVCVAAIVAVCISGANSISAVQVGIVPVVGIICSPEKRRNPAKTRMARIKITRRMVFQLDDLFLPN